MPTIERRESKRTSLYHPVMLNRNSRERCLAKILDAGHKGLRVRVGSPADITVGHDIEVTSARLSDSSDAARLHCRVVWQDNGGEELGLEYLTTLR